MEEIKTRIDSGEYLPGERIPAESHLCEMFGVSRITIRQAIRKLVDADILYTRHGKGTFVLPRKIKRLLPKLYSFSEDMREAGLTPSSRLLALRLEEPGEEVT